MQKFYRKKKRKKKACRAFPENLRRSGIVPGTNFDSNWNVRIISVGNCKLKTAVTEIVQVGPGPFLTTLVLLGARSLSTAAPHTVLPGAVAPTLPCRCDCVTTNKVRFRLKSPPGLYLASPLTVARYDLNEDLHEAMINYSWCRVQHLAINTATCWQTYRSSHWVQ